MSAGRFELHGQYLHQYFLRPEKGEPDVEYTITIRRI